MTTLESAISLLETVFINTSFFSSMMIPQAIVIVATLLFLSREVSDWQKLAFPVMIGWNAFGMYISPLLLAGAGTIMVINGLSTEVIGGAIRGITSSVKESIDFFGEAKKYGGLSQMKKTKKFDKMVSKLRESEKLSTDERYKDISKGLAEKIESRLNREGKTSEDATNFKSKWMISQLRKEESKKKEILGDIQKQLMLDEILAKRKEERKKKSSNIKEENY